MRCWSWLSICFTVSSPTPTMIRIEVPPKGKFWLAFKQDERHRGQQRDQPEVERAGEGQPGQHEGEVVLGRLAGTDAGDEAAVLLHVVGDLLRVEGDRDVEVGEEHDQQEERDHVDRMVAA